MKTCRNSKRQRLVNVTASGRDHKTILDINVVVMVNIMIGAGLTKMLVPELNIVIIMASIGPSVHQHFPRNKIIL